jgi:hypothetical protein
LPIPSLLWLCPGTILAKWAPVRCMSMGLKKSRKIDELATKDAQCFFESFVIA